MKKKLIALVTALTLCAAVVVGTTLAYYSAQTDTVQNTFTYSPDEDPKPEIEEPSWPDPPPKVSPEKVIPKDPRVTLTNTQTTLEYNVALVISGGTDLDTSTYTQLQALQNLKGIVNKTTTPITEKQFRVDAQGNRIPKPGVTNPSPTNDEDWLYDTVTIQQNNGIATIRGWSTDFTYEIGSDGTIYAYYKNTLKQGNLSTPPVFTDVEMYKEIQHFFEGLDSTQLDKPIFDIKVKGYVVSNINDTVTPNVAWNCKDSMLKAFPDVFTGHTATTNPPYEN